MKNFFNLAFLLISLGVWAQQVKVEGTIVDDSDFPQSFVTVTLDALTFDSFQETMTDENGYFEFDVRPGEYNLIIQPESGRLVTKKQNFTSNTNLGNIVISNAIQLSETVATGTKPLYRLELDKRVYDMSRDPSVRGASLSDALNNVPSVQVDGEGNLSLRGNENVRVLVDGKPSSMTGISNLADALKNIQADQVERVEVITNPSARYEAEGGGGIINLIMKKGANQGFNANVNVSVGQPLLTGIATNMNYKSENWNFFFSPFMRYDKPKGSSKFYNQFFHENGNDTIEIQNGDRVRERLNLGTGLGFERYFGEKNTLTVAGNMRQSNGNNVNELTYRDFTQGTMFGSSNRTDTENEKDKNYEGTVGFKHKFNNSGHELDIFTSGSWSEEDENSVIIENIVLGDGENTVDYSFSDEKQRRWLAQVDYVYPMGENSRLEAGYRGSWETNVNDFSVLQEENGEWVRNDLFSDRVDFDQDIQALYTQFGSKMGKFSYLLGLRMEHTAINIKSANANDGAGSENSKDYTNLFPSATLNFYLDEDNENQLQASYSRRIRRPWSRFLSPFSNFSDDRNVFQGNPDLDPTFSSNYELAYITQIGKTTITPSVYYQHSTQNMQMLRRLGTFNGNEIFLTTPVNAGEETRYGAELTASTQLARWWRVFGNVNLFGYKTDASYYDELTDTTYDLSGDGFSWMGRISNSITLPSKIEFQLNANYNGGQKNAQSNRKAMWSVDLALSKDIMQGNGTLGLNVRDLFNTRKMMSETFGDGFYSDQEMQWRQRQITLNFSYRINQKKKRERGERSEGMDGDEMAF